MELQHLRYFYEVAKAGSFSKAARALRISQPAVSKAIAQLEYREDLRLFDRDARSVRLTEHGSTLFNTCVRIFKDLEETSERIRGLHHELRGTIAIGASDNICNYLLPSLLAAFLSDHKKVKAGVLNGTSESIKSEILSGKLELGIFHSRVKERRFESETLGFVEFWVVTAVSTKRTEKHLKSERFIGPRTQDYANKYPICGMLESLKVTPNVYFESNSQETQKRLALQGYGYAVLPHYMLQEEIARGVLFRVPTSKKIGSNVYLVTKRGRNLSMVGTAFKQVLKESLFSG